MFSGSENLMAPSKRLLRPYFETGNDKFKMALPKPDLPVSQLLFKIAKKFQLLSACFGVRKLNGAIGKASS
jgi:hypothetical protein